MLEPRAEDAERVCPHCQVFKTASTRHCVICHRCVERYDHHCQWINNCVGLRNHNIFVLLLFSLLADFGFGIAMTVLAWCRLIQAGDASCTFSLDLTCSNSLGEASRKCVALFLSGAVGLALTAGTLFVL